MTLSKKDIMAIKIAFAIDEYYYNKDTKGYFDKMPVIGLADSQGQCKLFCVNPMDR